MMKDLPLSKVYQLLEPGPVVLLSRHASMIDTLIPIFIADENHLGCRYVLKNELLWDPALDIIGHRFPNYFVDRSGGNSGSAIDEVGALAAGTRDSEVFVIFPEGSRTPEGVLQRQYQKGFARVALAAVGISAAAAAGRAVVTNFVRG